MRSLPVHNPHNRFSREEVVYDEGENAEIRLEVHEDHTRNILSENDSPDLGFRFSVNPYRGCTHACAYCYARPSHEYLGFGAGTDFDRHIVIKPHAPELLREAFDRPGWRGELVVFSGVTDCYQPLEAKHQLTRGCLEVCLDYRNPVGIVTKSAIIERDVELLVALNEAAHVGISISIPFLDKEKARAVEPLVAAPERRLRVIERLARAGLDVAVNVAPIIPGLTDDDMPKIMEAARDAGAKRAHITYLRLPGAVAEVFPERLRQALPLRAEKVLRRIREARGGKLNDPRFGTRMRGEGEYAAMIGRAFELHAKRLGLNEQWMREPPPTTTFRRPPRPGEQLGLFSR